MTIVMIIVMIRDRIRYDKLLVRKNQIAVKLLHAWIPY